MTVQEFINKLKKCDPNKQVLKALFDGVDQWDEPADIFETDFNVYI